MLRIAFRYCICLIFIIHIQRSTTLNLISIRFGSRHCLVIESNGFNLKCLYLFGTAPHDPARDCHSVPVTTIKCRIMPLRLHDVESPVDLWFTHYHCLCVSGAENYRKHIELLLKCLEVFISITKTIFLNFQTPTFTLHTVSNIKTAIFSNFPSLIKL